MQELNRLGFIFIGAPSGYPAADVFALLLEKNKLSAKFKEIRSRSWRLVHYRMIIALDRNTLLRGLGQGIPGDGTEIVINPPIPINSPNIFDQIIVNVLP